jgi:small-conductance mechanosensitive channel/CRP-like cAMP-binding protein
MTSWVAAIGLAAAIVALALLVRATHRRGRESVRRTALIFVAYAVALLLHVAAPLAGLVEVGRIAGSAAALLGWISIANVVVTFVFEVALPRAGISLSSIVGDLAVGASYAIIVVGGMRRLGLDLSGIIATSAVVTAILALSLQATLGNVIGGVALKLDDSVREGDWIELDNGKQGRVREIRWRHTVIETRDWDTIIVPNSNLLAAQIVILGRREGEPLQHRMWVYFNVDFRHRPAEVIEAVDAALQAPPLIEGISGQPKAHCVCMDFARAGRDSFGYYAVRYWLTDLARDDPTSSKVRERIYAALNRARISLAVPRAQVTIEKDAGRRARKKKQELESRVEALGAIDLFSPLTGEEISRLAAALTEAPFAAGETITRQGAEAHWLYILARGSADILVEVGTQRRKVSTVEAPSVFGEMSLMTGAPRGATVVAKTDVDCYRLDRNEFRKIIEQRPTLVEELSKLMAHRQVELAAVREDLDAAQKEARLHQESSRLLEKIQNLFGLR